MLALKHPQSCAQKLRSNWVFLKCMLSPGDSDGKESTCNVGDLASITGFGRSPGEWLGYPLQYSCLQNFTVREAWLAAVHGVAKSWTRLSDFHFHFGLPVVAQTVKNLPVVRESQVRSLGWEDPLEKEIATHSSILAWKFPCTEEPGGLQSMGSSRVGHDWAINTHSHAIGTCFLSYMFTQLVHILNFI